MGASCCKEAGMVEERRTPPRGESMESVMSGKTSTPVRKMATSDAVFTRLGYSKIENIEIT